MLEMRSACESCDGALPAETKAFICSYECTWCPVCVAGFTDGACPNCGGDLQRRPTRVARA
ncbi:DUF1272 domain-containing protein [Microbacterium oleivorans]|uniref:DUF1272 domain-containing protein n=1 Tax=Microbacterium oleivorans TaxID=273677 RepID=UPI000565C827|nr:DUF1272 domain-containing protein [Microbacterium oleivorans]THE08239.1 DUF1272 domain-containing protein [Microbacterium oleivorans]